LAVLQNLRSKQSLSLCSEENGQTSTNIIYILSYYAKKNNPFSTKKLITLLAIYNISANFNLSETQTQANVIMSTGLFHKLSTTRPTNQPAKPLEKSAPPVL